MTTAIRVEGVGKRYVLGQNAGGHRSLRDALSAAFGGALRRDRAASAQTARDFWALKDVSFEVKEGQRVGIVGRNGAGKSTLLKVLSRITRPTTGRISITGRVASLLEVGTGFHPDLSGRENIYLNGAILGMTRVEIKRKFDQIVAFAEVEKFLDTPVKRYSSGMYVRLAFAVAAHLDPEILIVDEVLSVGDAEFQRKCIGKMQDVSAGEGRTVFFVSHNMAAVQSLCSHGVFLTRGSVTHVGSAREVVELYNKNGGSTSLASARAEGGDFELLKLEARAAQAGAPLTSLQDGLVEVSFRSRTRAIDAGVHILFEDLNGSPILGLDSNDFVTKVPAGQDQVMVARFRIADLPLNPGPYRLRVWLKSAQDFRAWEVPHSYDVEVEAAPVYGTREISRQWHGALAARATAEVVAA